jgi:ABC-type polysaccharide/polyol phosphate export permease
VAVLTVYLRDLRHVLPILLQVGLFATPVAYGIEVVPGNMRGLYSAVNPIAPVIDGLRRTVLAGQPPRLGLLGIGALSSVVQLVIGYRVFKRLETGIADVA